uniref:D-glucuronyl C5-epimerase beta-sandwich domain-containing protein n=1 Tax=Glossina pallidipes TaxID=7398 RepID=A0A1A9Z5H7_GLOPL
MGEEDFYPTQIAQFALPHYSKNLNEPEPRIRAYGHNNKYTVLENVDTVQANWLLLAKISNLTHSNSSSLMITVKNRKTKHTYRVHYIPVDLLLNVQDDNIYYGLGLQALNKRHHLTRDFHIDAQKLFKSNIRRTLSPHSRSRSISERCSYSLSPGRHNCRRKSCSHYRYDSRSRSSSRQPPSPSSLPPGRHSGRCCRCCRCCSRSPTMFEES